MSIVKRNEDGDLVHVNDFQRFFQNLELADRGMQALVGLDPREAVTLMSLLQDEISPGVLETILEIAV